MSIVESLTGCLPPTHLQSCFYTTSTLYHILLPLSTHFLPNSFLILFSHCNILPPERSHTMMPLHHVPVLSLEKSKVLLPCSVFVFSLSCTIIPTLEIQRPSGPRPRRRLNKYRDDPKLERHGTECKIWRGMEQNAKLFRGITLPEMEPPHLSETEGRTNC